MSARTLAELNRVLARIQELAAFGRDRFDADDLIRFGIERLWIFAGNLAAAHCEEEGILEGVAPWSEMIALRHVYAHYLPDQINSGRVWADTEGDIDRIRSEVAAATSG
ncbi:MAG: hypothetical protein LC792_28155 [Actinobacteria bacterium]|nr:hypothetical protein [Actinomycetota bacterium]